MKKLLLEKLLEKYERSKHARGAGKIRRRVTLNIGSGELARYHEGAHLEYRKALHEAARELEEQGLIRIEWWPFERGNLIKALHLELDRVDQAYHLAGRNPQAHILQALRERLTGLKLTAPWTQEFIRDCLEEIDRVRYPRQLPAEQEKLELLLAALEGLEAKGPEEMLERIFSKRYLGHSKAFEQKVRSRLAGLLRKYLGLEAGMEEEAVLAEVGLVKATGEVLICGPLRLRLKGALLDLTPFAYGLSLGSDTLSEAEVVGADCTRVLSVENKATFRALVRQGMDPHTLLLSLGGFPGPVKRRFMSQLYRVLGDRVTYYHWGDLDYGGLQIFRHLQKNCWPALQPLKMDVETYLVFRHLGEEFQEAYAGKLRGLLEEEEFRPFHVVIRAILAAGKTLEQEAVELDGQKELFS